MGVMTLPPIIALMPLLESARGAFARWLTVFGRVPFFFFMLHIPLVHAFALVVSTIRLGVRTIPCCALATAILRVTVLSDDAGQPLRGFSATEYG